MQIFKPDINIDFVGKRMIAISISLFFIIVSVIFLIIHEGLNLGIDFAGGTIVEVRFDRDVKIDDVREALAGIGLGKSIIQRFGESDILIKTEKSEAGKIGTQIRSALAERFKDTGFEVVRVEMVGPAAGQDLRLKGENALLYSIIGMIIYISYRFQNRVAIPIIAVALFTWILSATQWVNITFLVLLALMLAIAACILFELRQALAAIIALIHDVLITVGFLSIADKEFTLPVLAAILTIVGYSINDTIVVFDRIRENLGKIEKEEYAFVINHSVNQTLSRTILTSGLTFFAVLALFLFGGPVIHDFSFTLMVGVVVGTYSSIYIASSILIFWENLKKADAKSSLKRGTLKSNLSRAKSK